jgi:hypothetical protein
VSKVIFWIHLSGLNIGLEVGKAFIMITIASSGLVLFAAQIVACRLAACQFISLWESEQAQDRRRRTQVFGQFQLSSISTFWQMTWKEDKHKVENKVC